MPKGYVHLRKHSPVFPGDKGGYDYIAIFNNRKGSRGNDWQEFFDFRLAEEVDGHIPVYRSKSVNGEGCGIDLVRLAHSQEEALQKAYDMASEEARAYSSEHGLSFKDQTKARKSKITRDAEKFAEKLFSNPRIRESIQQNMARARRSMLADKF